MNGTKELAVVMPVYNEEACIEDVVESWHDTLCSLNIDFRLFILNDGSRDGTEKCLEKYAGHSRITVINKPNSGHGPTILSGYWLAVDEAEWIFQVDSDDEMSPCHFDGLWDNRGGFGALFGIRTDRSQGLGRRVISAVSRATVRLIYGKGVIDVNVPYRLIRASLLKGILPHIPADTFAPNIIISGALATDGGQIGNFPVPHVCRKTGTVSIVRWGLWKVAFRSLLQTIRCRPRLS